MPSRRQNISRRSPSSQSRIDSARVGIQYLFTGRSSVGTRSSTPNSPKTPRPTLGLGDLPSTRLVIPYLTRSASVRSESSSTRSLRSPNTPLSSRPATSNSLRQQTARSNISTIPPQVRHNSSRFVRVDPAEELLAELAQDGRRRRKTKSRPRDRTCARKVKNKKIRSKILSCFISGLVRYPPSRL
jgi:hypothetical protein